MIGIININLYIGILGIVYGIFGLVPLIFKKGK